MSDAEDRRLLDHFSTMLHSPVPLLDNLAVGEMITFSFSQNSEFVAGRGTSDELPIIMRSGPPISNLLHLSARVMRVFCQAHYFKNNKLMTRLHVFDTALRIRL